MKPSTTNTRDKLSKIANDIFSGFSGIKQSFFDDNDSYHVIFKNSDDYAKAYTRLENYGLVEIDPSATLLDQDINQLLYLGDDFDVKLIANFKEDTYKVVISKPELEEKTEEESGE